jgi:photoactive yellow protein
MSENQPAFEDANLADYLKSADDASIDALPFGVVRMQSPGSVTAYNQFEQDLAGLSKADVLAKDFFTEIAPCTNNFMVRERFIDGWESGQTCDEQIDYVFSYKMRKTKVRLRMLISGNEGWLAVKLR